MLPTMASADFQVSEDGYFLWMGRNEAVLSSEQFSLIEADFENPDETRLSADMTLVDSSSGQNHVRHEYTWGSVTLSWDMDEEILYGEVVIENNSALRIGDFSMRLLTLFSSSAVSLNNGYESFKRTNMDSYFSHSWIQDNQRLTLGLLNSAPPLYVEGIEENNEGPELEAWSVMLSGGIHRMEDGGVTFPLFGAARVEPHSSLAIPFVLKASSVSISNSEAEAFFRSQLHRETAVGIDWPDRRPIGSIFVTKFGGATELNPKALFWDEALDASDPEAVRASAVRFARNSVDALQQLDAQGAIVWDLEGVDLPIWFVGDPRMLPILNPAMDAVADEFFRILTDAGFRVGVTLRPTQVYFNEGDNQWSHGTGSHGGPGRNPLDESYEDIWPEGVPWWRFFPTVERLDRKIQYAKDRWDCSIFYIDSNGEFRMMNALGPQHVKWILLSARVFRELRERHPDVLIIPELEGGSHGQTHTAYWGTTAPYGELDLGNTATPEWVRDIYPEAVSIINVSDGDIEANREQLVEAVRNGDILMSRGWFRDSRNPKVREIYEEASAPVDSVDPD